MLLSYSKVSPPSVERDVHYRLHKGPPLNPDLSQISPVHTVPFFFSKINFIIIQSSKTAEAVNNSSFHTHYMFSHTLSYKNSTQRFGIFKETIIQRRIDYSILTPWSRVLLEKLIDDQIVTKYPAFYASRRFTTAFKSVRHLSLVDYKIYIFMSLVSSSSSALTS
jgi:hypothetical protein